MHYRCSRISCIYSCCYLVYTLVHAHAHSTCAHTAYLILTHACAHTYKHRGMADRITEMRVALRGSLEKLGSKRDWSHITNQIGMFCYTGLTQAEVLKIRADRCVCVKEYVSTLILYMLNFELLICYTQFRYFFASRDHSTCRVIEVKHNHTVHIVATA